jgi:predicted phosphodiesterase
MAPSKRVRAAPSPRKASRSRQRGYSAATKIAALSDIHGNLRALDAVLADIATVGADVIVNLGDSLSGPLQVAQTAARLREANLPGIAGNHERQLLDVWRGPATAIDTTTSDGYAATELDDDTVAWIAALPPYRRLTPRILLAHGTPGSDLHYWLETVTPDAGIDGSRGMRAATHEEARERLHTLAGAERASLIFCGHTHVPARCNVEKRSSSVSARPHHLPHNHISRDSQPQRCGRSSAMRRSGCVGRRVSTSLRYA